MYCARYGSCRIIISGQIIIKGVSLRIFTARRIAHSIVSDDIRSYKCVDK